MLSRVVFLNRDGVPLEDIAVSTRRSYLLNDVGDCVFTFPIRDEKLIDSLVQVGNYVWITNAYTQAWVGILEFPRTWTPKGLRLTAFTPEVLFSYFQEQDIDQQTNLLNDAPTLYGKAGGIFKKIIEKINQTQNTLLRIGAVYAEGADRQETLTNDYLTHLRNLSQRSGNDFDIVASMQSNNYMLLNANWYQRKGKTIDIVLEEGVNIELMEEQLTEQGIIQNSVLGIGQTESELETKPIAAIYRDTESIKKYGIRQSTVIYSDVSKIATLKDNVKNYTLANSYPFGALRVNCTDLSLAKLVSVGDEVTLVLHSAGFLANGTIGLREVVKVIGIFIDDDKESFEVLLSSFILRGD